MAAAAGKKSTTSLSFSMEAFGLLWPPSIGTEGDWIGKWPVEQQEAWMNQALEVQTWRQVRGPAGAVVCETSDLGIKWAQRHTSIFEGDRSIDMRYVCPKDVKKMLLQQARTVCWKKWAAKHEYEDLTEGETLPENWFWMEAGCRGNSSTLVGRIKSECQACHKAQKSTGFATVPGNPRGFQKVGAESENIQEGVEVAERYYCASSQ